MLDQEEPGDQFEKTNHILEDDDYDISEMVFVNTIKLDSEFEVDPDSEEDVTTTREPSVALLNENEPASEHIVDSALNSEVSPQRVRVSESPIHSSDLDDPDVDENDLMKVDEPTIQLVDE